MPGNPTRRQVLASGATAALASPLLAAQAVVPEQAERELAKPLSDEARRLLKDALAGVNRNAENRWKHRLKEGSEPCFTYLPESREVLSR